MSELDEVMARIQAQLEELKNGIRWSGERTARQWGRRSRKMPDHTGRAQPPRKEDPHQDDAPSERQ